MTSDPTTGVVAHKAWRKRRAAPDIMSGAER
jgi:hypothetical protein